MFKKALLLLLLLTAVGVSTSSNSYSFRSRYYDYAVNEYIIYHYYAEYYGFRSLANTFPEEAEQMHLTIPYSDYNEFVRGGIDSAITFSSSTGAVDPITITFAELSVNQDRPHGEYIIYFSEIDPEHDRYEFNIMQSWESLPAPPQLFSYFNENTFVEFDIDNFVVVFFVGNEVYQVRAYDDFVPKPDVNPVPPAGYRFTHWRTAEGTIFDFDTLAAQDLGLYATFVPILLFDETAGERDTEGNIMALLSYWGWYNTAGLMIIFGVIMILVNVPLVFMRAPKIGIVFINLIVVIILSVFGMLPIWAAFTVGLLLLLFLFQLFRGGMQIE